jgi:hypothetical protein
VPLYVAVIVTDVDVETASVATMKVALELPAATVADVGTVAADVLLLESVTPIPPVGATPVRVIVAVDELPPDRDDGLRFNELSEGGLTVSVAVFVALL